MKNYAAIARAWRELHKNDRRNAFANAEARARVAGLGGWQGRTTDTSVKTNKRKKVKNAE